MANVKLAYSASANFTLTLASLASSATGGRESTEIDNTTDLYLDALVYVKVVLGAGTSGNDKAVYIYAYGGPDGTAYPDAVTGANAAITLNDPTQLRLIGVINAPTSAGTFDGYFSVAQAFGGVLPPWWGIVVRNYSGIALSATEGNHAYSWRGVYQTVT
jgi:hypothetical protein